MEAFVTAILGMGNPPMFRAFPSFSVLRLCSTIKSSASSTGAFMENSVLLFPPVCGMFFTDAESMGDVTSPLRLALWVMPRRV